MHKYLNDQATNVVVVVNAPPVGSVKEPDCHVNGARSVVYWHSGFSISNDSTLGILGIKKVDLQRPASIGNDKSASALPLLMPVQNGGAICRCLCAICRRLCAICRRLCTICRRLCTICQRLRVHHGLSKGYIRDSG